MRVLLRLVAAALVCSLLLLSCSDPFQGDGEKSPDYRIARNSAAGTVTIDELVASEGSDPQLYVRLNRSGYEVREYPVAYRGMDYYDLIIALKHPGDVTVGHGDSGSPIVDSRGRVVAALYAGDTTNKELFFARPIENMTEPLGVAASQALSGRETLLARHFVGITPESLGEIRSRLGLPEERILARPETETRAGAPRETAAGASTSGEESRLAARQSATASPGQSILVRYLDGNLFRSYVSGTVSYVAGEQDNGGSILAFGHGVIGAGSSSAPVDLVAAVGFVESYRYPYKVVDPFVSNGNALGYLVQEAYSGVRVTASAAFGQTTVSSTLTVPGSDLGLRAEHTVAPTSRSTQDHYFQTMAILSPLIYQWERAYNQEGNVTVSFRAFTTSGEGGSDLSNEANGITGVSEGPLEILYDDYLAAEAEGSYLSYVVEKLYDLVRATYRSQPAGTRFGTITTDVTLTE